ncbi:hypothetical protein GCM10028803_50800 [Larkinella knui]
MKPDWQDLVVTSHLDTIRKLSEDKEYEKQWMDWTKETKAEMNLLRKEKFEPAPLTWQEVLKTNTCCKPI